MAFTAYKGKLKRKKEDKFSLLENNVVNTRIDALNNTDSCGQKMWKLSLK